MDQIHSQTVEMSPLLIVILEKLGNEISTNGEEMILDLLTVNLQVHISMVGNLEMIPNGVELSQIPPLPMVPVPLRLADNDLVLLDGMYRV